MFEILSPEIGNPHCQKSRQNLFPRMPLVSGPWVLQTAALRLGTMGSRSYSSSSSLTKSPFYRPDGISSPGQISQRVAAGTGIFSFALLASRSVRTHPTHGTRHYSIVAAGFTQRPIHTSSLPLKPRLRFPTSFRKFHTSQQWRYDRLQNLEDAANRDRDNANAQAVFLQVSRYIYHLTLGFIG